MKRILFSLFTAVLLIFVFSTGTKGADVYEFDLAERDERAEGALDSLIESIPEEIRDELPEDEKATDIGEYDGEYFFKMIEKSIKEAVSPALKTASVLIGTVILAALFNIFAETVSGEGVKNAFSFCSSLCVALCIFSSMKTVFSVVKALLDSLSQTMLLIIPTMEAIYIRSGNLTAAAVTSTGVSLMIGFTESLFAKVLEPAVYTVFILAVTASVTKNRGIGFMAKTLRGLITGGVVAVMALLSFVLALQSGAAGAYDSFAAKTLKFAIGNYIPFVGGPIADSFTLFSGSLGVIKQSSGLICIAALVAAFLPPLFVVLMNRIAIGLSGAAADALGCEREGALIGECRGICTVLFSVCAGAVVMYIIALGIFVRLPAALG